MPIEIIVPRLGWSMEEGAFVAWLKRDGEFVESGDRLISIEGDKAIQEIESIVNRSRAKLVERRKSTTTLERLFLDATKNDGARTSNDERVTKQK